MGRSPKGSAGYGAEHTLCCEPGRPGFVGGLPTAVINRKRKKNIKENIPKISFQPQEKYFILSLIDKPALTFRLLSLKSRRKKEKAETKKQKASAFQATCSVCGSKQKLPPPSRGADFNLVLQLRSGCQEALRTSAGPHSVP